MRSSFSADSSANALPLHANELNRESLECSRNISSRGSCGRPPVITADAPSPEELLESELFGRRPLCNLRADNSLIKTWQPLNWASMLRRTSPYETYPVQVLMQIALCALEKKN